MKDYMMASTIQSMMVLVILLIVDKSGVNDGLNEGIDDGLKEGFNDGINDGVSDGIDDGANEGLNDGNEEGLNVGMISTTPSTPETLGSSRATT
eukprot:CAMPEP_0202442094 /NCGR_PEP_ID=MMETSP1360-20130828/1568_1 /ASSEMBLY_ACC=CAM_ASM_000848 /TAXON_ID=515479 /ORGANISM="Licmophora paradoxa, Strain CCMP2313" /LENGTH=93 /DNA_ID=CAMNT_0049057347 /DNA_START=271 /DNA_END=549 /DNA_ORIENTATION=+